MPWFRCLIRGENFPGQLIGKPYDIGFYVTRFVEAADATKAESAALMQLRVEPKLTIPPGCNRSLGTRVYFENIQAVGADAVPEGATGFAWYPMTEDDSPEGHERVS